MAKSLKDARDLGHKKAQQAADHAGEEWKASAFEAFVKYAKKHKQFTTQDVRFSNEELAPKEPRAWGAIARAALREGYIEFGGFIPVSSSRGGAKTLWRSLVA